MNKFFTIIIVFMVLGCSYSFNFNSYPQLKTIYIENIENESDNFELDETALTILTEEFNSDSRLKLVTKNQDCTLAGKIMDYSDKALTYDLAENINQRKVRILFSISFKDEVNDEMLWEDTSFAITEKYTTDESSEEDIPKSEEEAVEEIFKELYKKIIRNTLESW